MKVKEQIQSLWIHVSLGCGMLSASDVFKCCTKTRSVKFKRGKIVVPVGQENISLCERASEG